MGIMDMSSRLMEISPGYNQPVEVKDAMIAKINSLLPLRDCSEWNDMFCVAIPDDFFAGEPDPSFLDKGRFINPKYEFRRENSSGEFVVPQHQAFLMNQTSYISLFYRGKLSGRIQFRIKPN